MAGLIRDSTTNATYGPSATAMKKGGRTFSGRKPLSDVSNRNQTSRKKQNRKLSSRKKPNRKVSAVTEELFHEKDIADEGFLHNHDQCIKVQAQHDAMDMDDFLKTIGLANGCLKELPSLERPETLPMTPLRLLEEMPKQPFSDRSAKKFDFSPPKSPDDDQFWKFWEDRDISLKLLDSP